MNGTIFLHIATVFNDDLSPIAAESCTRPDVTIFADDYIACNGSKRMNEAAFVDYGDMVVEFVNGPSLKVVNL